MMMVPEDVLLYMHVTCRCVVTAFPTLTTHVLPLADLCCKRAGSTGTSDVTGNGHLPFLGNLHPTLARFSSCLSCS